MCNFLFIVLPPPPWLQGRRSGFSFGVVRFLFGVVRHCYFMNYHAQSKNDFGPICAYFCGGQYLWGGYGHPGSCGSVWLPYCTHALYIRGPRKLMALVVLLCCFIVVYSACSLSTLCMHMVYLWVHMFARCARAIFYYILLRIIVFSCIWCAKTSNANFRILKSVEISWFYQD